VKRQKQRQKQKQRQSPRLRKYIPEEFTIPSQIFNILPSRLFPPSLALSIAELPIRVKDRTQYLNERFPQTPCVEGDPFSSINKYVTEFLKTRAVAIRNQVIRIQRCRHLFSILLHHIRFRRLKSANTTDIVTMEVPKVPIHVIDWQRRQRYVFEAATLMRDITCRLLSHDGMFESPQPPRNPYTNIPFTQGQLISVWNSLGHATVLASSAFPLFYKSHFCMERFTIEHFTYLKLNALKKTMQETNSYDYKDYMTDFASNAYIQEGVVFDTAAFSYCLDKFPQHPLLLQWKQLCYRFYEAGILYGTNAKPVKDEILDDTVELLDLQRQFVSLYNKSNESYSSHGINFVELFNQMLHDGYTIITYP
jgi:hypothetical protein